MDKYTVSLLCLSVLFGLTTPYPQEDGEELMDPNELLTFSMPESCKSQNMQYCFDKTDDYPDEAVEELLKDMTNLEMAKDDDVGVIENRSGGPYEDDCRASSTDKPIYYIVDENGIDRVVVQMEGRFEQRYSVTECEKKGPMQGRSVHFLKDTVQEFKMSCDNKYLDYDFLVLSLERTSFGKWKMERVKAKNGIPVCCACRYEKENN